MTTNYLLCPIPTGHPSNACYRPRPSNLRTVDFILSMIRNRKKPTHDANGFWILDSAKVMYNRLFKPIGQSRKKKSKPYNVYAIFNPAMTPISVFKTRAEAIKLLGHDVIPYSIFGKYMTPGTDAQAQKYNEVPVGSTVIRIPMIGPKVGFMPTIDTDQYPNPKDSNFYKMCVATKRCSSCPRNKNPSAAECGCSLINNIRDQVPGWTTHTKHQLLMKKHRDRKKVEKVIEVSFDDLFE